jgi:hypothetical protein
MRLRLVQAKVALAPPAHLFLADGHLRAAPAQRHAQRLLQQLLLLRGGGPSKEGRALDGPRREQHDGRGRGSGIGRRGGRGQGAREQAVQVGAHRRLVPELGRVERRGQGERGQGVCVVGAVGGGEGEVR